MKAQRWTAIGGLVSVLAGCGGITENHAARGHGGASGASSTGGIGGLAGTPDASADSAFDSSVLDAEEHDSPDGAKPVCPLLGPGSGGATKCATMSVECACGLSCCDQRLIPGGSFLMGRSLNGSDAFAQGADIELPEHSAQVSPFYLDTFEVTVARFRPFVKAYPDSLPNDGQGAHPTKPGTGWQSAWAALLPKTRAELESYDLACAGVYPYPISPMYWEPTYTPEPGPYENRPINCVNWYEAFAFCVWEGGRLPTEAEWEYAAAGGEENRLYPWGSVPPGSSTPPFDHSCMSFFCLGKHETLAGVGRWANFDLGGAMMEWVLDTLAPYASESCSDCIVFDFDPNQPKMQARGGSYASEWSELRAAWRSWPSGWALTKDPALGFRCARSP